MNEDFTDYPVSVSERRSDLDGNGAKWTPRDALIYLLRRIDAGQADVDALVIAYRQKFDQDDDTQCRFSCATPDVCTALGLLSYAQISLAT